MKKRAKKNNTDKLSAASQVTYFQELTSYQTKEPDKFNLSVF